MYVCQVAISLLLGGRCLRVANFREACLGEVRGDLGLEKTKYAGGPYASPIPPLHLWQPRTHSCMLGA